MKLAWTVVLIVATGWGQTDYAARNSDDAKMAPRSLLLTGGPLDSARGLYVIEFPPPNECVEIAPVRATSRPMALYTAVSNGGFALKVGRGGLTVWTIEEWEALRKESWYSKFKAQKDEHCKAQKP